MRITKIWAGSFAVLALLSAWARAEEKPKLPIVPLKIDVVFSEYEGEKKVASLPYTVAVNANEREQAGIFAQSTNLRMGVNVPIGTDKEGKVDYQYVGSSVDCWAGTTDDGRYRVHLSANRSSLYFPSSEAEKKSVGYEGSLNAMAQPMIRRFDANFNLLMRDGQTIENTVATDPINGRVWKIAVTLHVAR